MLVNYGDGKIIFIATTKFRVVYSHTCSLYVLFAVIKAHGQSKFSLEEFSCFFM